MNNDEKLLNKIIDMEELENGIKNGDVPWVITQIIGIAPYIRADERAKMKSEGYDKIYTAKEAQKELKRLSQERRSFQEVVSVQAAQELFRELDNISIGHGYKLIEHPDYQYVKKHFPSFPKANK